ncbi:hypothetical protein DPMN_163276 [Dreissena polymorpha]|uniref:Uncharacterized protein n=1 Tax=Dreissena polymorpha TaxID=45954 RepID=A0A9D4ESZ7_DREPO|nr:hypothetical protein DPMN_163276 [Dreissena polymorpha]
MYVDGAGGWVMWVVHEGSLCRFGMWVNMREGYVGGTYGLSIWAEHESGVCG